MRATTLRPLVVLCLLGTSAGWGCHAHVRQPGQVTVIEYERVDRVEVELADLGARSDAGVRYLISAAAVRDGGVCSPVVIRIASDRGPADGPAALAADAFLEPLGTPEGGGFAADPLRFATWANSVGAAVDLATDRLRMHDEHLYNLAAFARELGCQ